MSYRLVVFMVIACLTDAVFGQNTPIYRVPSEHAYFTAENTELPQYPSEALKNGVGGDVIVVLEFSTDGIVEVANRVSGDPLLASASVEAVKSWKFHPVIEKGKKAKGLAYLGFHFQPSSGSVAVSFPFGKWEETTAADPAATGTEKQASLVHIERGIAAQNRIDGSNPKYPPSAKSRHIEGAVELRAIIDTEGHISLLEVTKTPSPELALAAVEAVKTWRYKPYVQNGENTEVETGVVINYQLR